MSEVITDKLTGRATAGNVTITSEGGSATMQLQQGVAKVWADFQGNNTATLHDSFNVSSLDDDGTGDYSLNFTNAMNNGDFCCSIMSSNNDRRNNADNTSTELHIGTFNTSGTAEDGNRAYGSVTGDLA
jgi:hypothetical protein